MTPTAQLAVNGGSQHPDKRRAGGHGPTLADQVEHVPLLPTPDTGQSPNGHGVRGGARGNGHQSGVTVSRVIRDLLPTPSGTLGSAGSVSRGGSRRDEMLLGGLSRNLAVHWGRYGPAIRRWEGILRPAPRPVEPGRNGQPVLAPAFVEWMMGIPEGHVTAVPGLTRAQQLRAIGNGVVPAQIAMALARLLPALPWMERSRYARG